MIAALLLSFAALSACVAYDPIPNAEIETLIRPGDYLRVRTRSDHELTLRVVEVDSDEACIVGKDRWVDFAEIRRIERPRVDWGRTATEVGWFSLFVLLAITASLGSFEQTVDVGPI